MQFHDISTSKKTSYVLKENEKVVFFMRNRSGVFEFTLDGRGAEAYVFALFEGIQGDQFSLKLKQHHRAPDTTSSALVTSLLSDNSSFTYQGLIRIEKGATKTDAKQENRNLILSESASAISVPALEILESDVICEHASTTGTLPEEAIFYIKTRWLSQEQARALLAEGFKKNFFETINRYGKFDERRNSHKI